MIPTAPFHAPTEMDGVRQALVLTQPGDVILLPVHVERDKILGLTERLVRESRVQSNGAGGTGRTRLTRPGTTGVLRSA